MNEATRIAATVPVSRTLQEISEQGAARYAGREPEPTDLEAEKAKAVADLAERMRRWGVPRRYAEGVAADARLGARLEPTSALDHARKFCEGAELFLVLSGPRGCGKTMAAAYALATPPLVPGAAATDAPDRLFRDVSELAFLRPWSEEGRKALAELEGAGVLVIDDLGRERLDEGGVTRSILEAVVNDRYGNKRRTILTTNLTAVDFSARYEARITDRIGEEGRFVELVGANLRREK